MSSISLVLKDIDRLKDRVRQLERKCAHCPNPATVDITLGDPINYSLCQRCADIEDSQSDARADAK